MPWTCKTCGTDVPHDSVLECPTCSKAKSAWTLNDATRTFRIARRKEPAVLVGTLEEALPRDDERAHDPERVDADTVPVVPKACVRGFAEQGLLPPPALTTWVLVKAKPGAKPTVTLSINYEEDEVDDRAFPYEGPEITEETRVGLAFLFVFGAGDLEGVTFPGIEIVDLSEETALRRVPTVDVAVRKQLRELPTRVGLCPECGWLAVELRDASGSVPLPGQAAAVELPGAGRVELTADDAGRILYAGVPFADYALEVGDGAVHVPAVPEGEELHVRHVHHARRGFLRVQVRDPDGFPLDDETVRLTRPDGSSVELQTDSHGFLKGEEPLPEGDVRVTAPGAEGTLTLPDSPRGLVIARLA